MKIASEFITHPRPAEVLDVPEAGFASYLTQVLDKHVSLEVPDFDRLFGTGQLTRIRGIDCVEALVLAWLERHQSAQGADTVASFLGGYWTGDRPILVPLFCRLVTALAELGSGEPAFDTLTIAIGMSYGRVDSANARDDAERAFEAIRARSRGRTLQPSVVRAIDQVLAGRA